MKYTYPSVFTRGDDTATANTTDNPDSHAFGNDLPKVPYRTQENIEIAPARDFSPKDLLRIGASCCQHLSTPVADALLLAAKKQDIPLLDPTFLEEVPQLGIRARISFGEVLCGNRSMMDHYQISLSKEEGLCKGPELFLTINGIFAGRLVLK
ncbi:hypothetical protein FACS1894111_12140 [Clostridia bacterium]|nr:hypothetical protein FACS1894111_12140 [Clostridia bacterium]